MHKNKTNPKSANRNRQTIKSKNNITDSNKKAQRHLTPKYTYPKKSKKLTQDIQTIRNNTQKKQNAYLTYRSNQMTEINKTGKKGKKNSNTIKQIAIEKPTFIQDRQSPGKNIDNKNVARNIQFISDQKIENQERLQMLKTYLKEDTQKITKMKKISDAHVISEMELSHDKLYCRLDRSQQKYQQLLKQHREIVEKLQKQSIKQKQQHNRQLRQMQKKIKVQKQENRRILKQLSQLKDQLSLNSNITKRNQNTKIQSSNMELLAKINIFQKQIASLQTKTMNFNHQKHQLQQKISKHQKQKQYIKQNLIEILQFIRKLATNKQFQQIYQSSTLQQTQKTKGFLAKFFQSLF